MKTIIVAAGRGNRLMPITDDKPKCLLESNVSGLMGIRKEINLS